MRHKITISIILILILTVFSMNVFADNLPIEDRILSNKETASAIEILSPEVGTDGDVLIKDDNLYVNIRLSQPVVVYYSLYKMDSNIFGSESKVIDVIEQQVIYKDLENEDDLEVLENEVDIQDSLPEILSELDKEKFRARIISEYNESKQEIEELEKLLKEFRLENVIELSEIESLDDVSLLSKSQKETEDKLEELLNTVKEEEEVLKNIEFRYNQLFEQLILEQEEVEVSDVLPYYKSEIESIDSGRYKMVFYSDKETKKAIKVFYFTIKSSKETLEKIVDTIPKDLNEIWLVEPAMEIKD